MLLYNACEKFIFHLIPIFTGISHFTISIKTPRFNKTLNKSFDGISNLYKQIVRIVPVSEVRL